MNKSDNFGSMVLAMQQPLREQLKEANETIKALIAANGGEVTISQVHLHSVRNCRVEWTEDKFNRTWKARLINE